MGGGFEAVDFGWNENAEEGGDGLGGYRKPLLLCSRSPRVGPP